MLPHRVDAMLSTVALLVANLCILLHLLIIWCMFTIFSCWQRWLGTLVVLHQHLSFVDVVALNLWLNWFIASFFDRFIGLHVCNLVRDIYFANVKRISWCQTEPLLSWQSENATVNPGNLENLESLEDDLGHRGGICHRRWVANPGRRNIPEENRCAQNLCQILPWTSWCEESEEKCMWEWRWNCNTKDTLMPPHIWWISKRQWIDEDILMVPNILWIKTMEVWFSIPMTIKVSSGAMALPSKIHPENRCMKVKLQLSKIWIDGRPTHESPIATSLNQTMFAACILYS